MALRNFLKEKWADINVFDGGRTGATVRAERAMQNKPAPAQLPTPGSRPGLTVGNSQVQQQLQIAAPEPPKPQLKIDTQQFRQPTVKVASPAPTADLRLPSGQKMSTVPKTPEDVVNAGLDAGKSWEDISRETGIDLNAIRTFSQSTRPNYGVAMQQPQQSIGNKLRDVFDANTEADKYRRFQANQERMRIGGTTASGQVPVVAENPGNLASNTIGAIPRMMNTAANQIVEGGFTVQQQFATAEYSAATEQYRKAVMSGDPTAIADAKFRLEGAAKRVGDIENNIAAAKANYKTNSGGLLNAGTLYNEEDSYSGDLATGLRKIGGGTAEGMLDAASFGITGASGKTISQMGLKAGLKKEIPNIIKNGLINSGQGGASAYRQGGDLDDIFKATALAGTVGTVADIGLATAGGLAVPKIIQAGRSLASLPEDGFISLPTRKYAGLTRKEIITDTAKLDALNEARQLLETGTGSAQTRNLVGQKLHEIYQEHGLDFITGSIAERKQRLLQFLEQNGEAIPLMQRSLWGNEGGYVQVPGKRSPLQQALFDEQEFLKNPNVKGGVRRTSENKIRDLEQRIAAGETELPVPGEKPAAAKIPGAEEVAPADKKSRFANKTVQNSEEVSEELKKSVRDENVTYTPHTNKERLAAADDFLKKNKSNEKAYTKIIQAFEDEARTTDQDVVNAIQAAKRMDASGKEDDLFRATEIYDNLSRHLTKKGQEVQAASLLGNRTPQGLIYTAQKNLRKAGVELTPEIQKDIKRLVDEVKKQTAGTYEDGLARFNLMEYVAKKAPSAFPEKAVQLWKAGLLTAPTTTAGNLLANTVEQVFKHGYKDPVAAAWDQIFSVFTGKRSKSFTLRGTAKGAMEGTDKGLKYFKTGYDPRNPMQKFDVNSIHYSETAAGKAAEKYTQTVFRLMGSQDQPFYYASLRNSLYDQAITEAKNAGVKGNARKEFIRKFVSEPTQEAMQLADKEARYDVFQNPTKLGELASKVNQGALGQFIIPFSQVPSSVATRMIDRTPIGIAKEIVKQARKGKFDQRAMSDAIGNGSAGIALIGAGAVLAKYGLLTTSYPTEKTERDLWELEGKQANSVKIGDKWISLNYMQPLGTLFAAGANYQKARSEGKSKFDAWTSASAGASKALTEQSFLKGISGGLEALSDPQRAGEKFAEQTVGSVTPNIIRSTARSIDPAQREKDNLADHFIAGIPGLSQTLPEKTDVFGETVPRRTSALSSFINPLRPSDIRNQDDPVVQEMRRLQNEDLGVTATKITANALGGDVKLTDDQQRELKVEIGQRLKSDWERIISDPYYNTLSDEDKKKKLAQAKDDITGAYKARYGVKNSLMDPDPKKLSTNEKRILMNDAAGNPQDINYFQGYEAELEAAEVAKFKESNSKSQQIGNRIYYKNKDGDVKSKSLFDYEYDKEESKIKLSMDRAKGANNLSSWLEGANGQLQLLEMKKAQYDPVFESDEIDKITLQQENLLDTIAKYQDYGGFRKGSSGSKTGSKLGLDYSMFGLSNMLGTQKSLRQILNEARLK